MSKGTKILWLVALLTVIAAGFRMHYAEESHVKRLGFAQESNAHPFRLAETGSLKEYAAENGYEFVFTDAENDLAKQVTNCESLIAQNVDYLVIAPRESEGFADVFARAKEAGIPVILIDRRAAGEPGKDFTAVITSDFVWEGEQAAQWFLAHKSGNINVVELQGTPGASVATDRHDGFFNVVAQNPRLQVVASQNADFDRANGQRVMANILQAKGVKGVDAVYAHNDEMALGAVAAIKEAGLVVGKDIMVIGVDGQKEAADAVKNHEMSATVTCDPHFGRAVFELIGKIEKKESFVPVQFVTDNLYDINNVKEYKNPF